MKKIFRTVLASAVGLGLIAGTGIAAQAAPTINTDADVSLTITKFEQPQVMGSSSNGLEVTDLTGLTPLEGVEFSATKLANVDLGTNAGWDAYNTLLGTWDANDPEEGLTLSTTPVTGITNEAGVIAWDNAVLDGVGAYLVQETGFTPTGSSANITEDQITKAMPFLVTLPVTDPTTNAWVYNVFVYPKNVISSVDKTVVDGKTSQLGDTAVWGIFTTITKGGSSDRYALVDNLDAKLAYTGTTVTVIADTNADIILIPTTDYTAVLSGDTDGNGGTVTVELTEDGRIKISEALTVDDTSKVRTSISTTVVAAGEIDNTVTFHPNATTAIESEEATTKFGGFTLTKTDMDDAETLLENAGFKVYVSNSPLVGGQLPNDAEQITGLVGMSAIDNIVRTDVNGNIVLDGLRYSDWANGVGITNVDDDYNYYFLVEVEAPTGYNLLSQPHQFVVDGQSDAVSVGIANKAIDKTPETGGSGIWLSLGVAGVLMVSGLALARKKKVTA